MAVSFDAHMAAPSFTSYGNTAYCYELSTQGTLASTTNMTVGSGSNRALVVLLLFNNSSVTGVSVTWDYGGTNQAMSLISSSLTDTSLEPLTQLWGLVNPASGNLTLQMAWTTGCNVAVGAVSFTGVDQTGGTTTFKAATPTLGTSASQSITISSTTGNYTVANMGCDDGSVTNVSQSEAYEDDGILSSAGSYATGAATVTHNFTTSGIATWCVLGVDIVAASGGGGAAGYMWL
jgi:hypothetical protein